MRRRVMDPHAEGHASPVNAVGVKLVLPAPGAVTKENLMTLQLLTGVRVLDISILQPGNMTAGLLADLGADVIKIEPPPAGDYMREVFGIEGVAGLGAAHLTFNRNKRSLALDLKKDEAKTVFFALLNDTDIVFDLSLPGTREKLGVDYESCRDRKPDIIYCSLTGFGYTGPFSAIPAHGTSPAAMLGGLQISAVDSGGFRFTSSGGDAGISAAPMLAALTMVAALAHRDRTGKGCWLETSLVDAGVFSRHVDVFRHFNPGYQVRMPVIENAAPKYNVYRCSDGKFVMFMPAERKFWQRFCAAVQRPEWADRGTWASQMDYGIGDDELARGLETLFHTKTQREWVMWLGPLGIPICPAGPLDELLDDDEFIAARALVARYHEDRLDDDIALAAFPVKRSGVPFRVERPAPDVGQHNDEILGELGYDGAAIAAMYASGAVFRPSR